MKRFAALFAELDRSTATLAKVVALKRYFAIAAPRDAAWAVYFLAGGKPRQVVPSAVLSAAACRRAGIDEWLFDACYQAVGDLAETVAHVLPPPRHESDIGLAAWIEDRLLTLRGLSPEEQAARVASYWDELDGESRFLLNKLIGGGFRVGVSKLLVQRALAEGAGIDPKLVAQRMMGYTDARTAPSEARYAQLTGAVGEGPVDLGQPYPFFLAHQLDLPHAEFESRLASPSEWIVEWKYDGIPGPDRQARRPGLDLVARRRARDRPLPRTRRSSAAAARRHRARWRGDRLEGRQGAALRAAAATHRPHDAQQEGTRRCAGGLYRLRRARGRRRRPAQRAAGSAQGHARSPAGRPAGLAALADRDGAELGRVRGQAHRIAGPRRGGLHAQAPSGALRHRP